MDFGNVINIGDCEIITKGNTIKLPGMKIIRVPENKMCFITGFHFSGNKVVKYGEISFVEKEKNYLLDIYGCLFEG